MKPAPADLTELYTATLAASLEDSKPCSSKVIEPLLAGISSARLSTARLATLHHSVLVQGILPTLPADRRALAVSRGSRFLAAVIQSMAGAAGKNSNPRQITELIKHSTQLFLANQEFAAKISRHKDFEQGLRASQRQTLHSLKESDRLKQQMRGLSRQILTAQEDERRKISRDLHDVVAQALVGINIRLATLKKEAVINSNLLDRHIAATQRVIAKSAVIVSQFARELRPAVLDDLGLIPALHAYMKRYIARTGIRASLTTFADVEKLGIERRIAIFRVIQEALVNVARHARASSAEITLEKTPEAISLTIQDNGRSFDVARVFTGRNSKRLGLLGMRERIEMVGGVLTIESETGHGTTVHAKIPCKENKSSKSSKPIRTP